LICWRRAAIIFFNLCNSSSDRKVWFTDWWLLVFNELIGQTELTRRRKCRMMEIIGELKPIFGFVNIFSHFRCLLTLTKQTFVLQDFCFVHVNKSNPIFILAPGKLLCVYSVYVFVSLSPSLSLYIYIYIYLIYYYCRKYLLYLLLYFLNNQNISWSNTFIKIY